MLLLESSSERKKRCSRVPKALDGKTSGGCGVSTLLPLEIPRGESYMEENDCARVPCDGFHDLYGLHLDAEGWGRRRCNSRAWMFGCSMAEGGSQFACMNAASDIRKEEELSTGSLRTAKVRAIGVHHSANSRSSLMMGHGA
jgi:hypothetical protein